MWFRKCSASTDRLFHLYDFCIVYKQSARFYDEVE